MLTHVESSRTMATGLSSGRILVVDDDPAVREATTLGRCNLLGVPRERKIGWFA